MKVEANSSRPANPLGSEKTGRLLRQFAIPSIVAMLVSSLYNIVDQIFIGQGVGYLGNGATNVAYPLTTISLAIALLIGVGSAANYALALGAGHQKQAGEFVGNAFWMIVLLGLAYSVLVEIFLLPLLLAFGATEGVLPYAIPYVRITALGMPFLIFTSAMCNLIRADGDPRYSMLCMLVGAIINTILDPIFIFGLDLGVAGAAWATVISQAISFGMTLRYLWRFQQVELGSGFLRPRFSRWGRISALGISSSLNQVAITAVQIVMNNSLTYYGALSVYGEDIPLSAVGVVMKVNSLFIAVFVGLAQGSQPIVGYNYGARQYQRVREVYKLAVACSLVVSAAGFLLFQLCPRAIISLFGAGEELYYEFAVKFMRTFLFMIIINGVQLISANFFSAIGKPLKGLVLSLSRQFLFLIPLLLILPRFFGINGILFAAPISDAMAFIFSILFILAEFRRLRGLERLTE